MKIIPLLLALCAALSLTACSTDEPATAPKVNVQPATQSVAPAVEQAKQVAQQVSENVAQVAQQVEEKTAAVVAQAKDTLSSGQAIYTKACLSCHKLGILGAPKVGDKSVWAKLSASGTKKLVDSAINGTGRMPAKGGIISLSDEEVAAAVDYMLAQSR